MAKSSSRNADFDADIAVIGAGIIGLACAFRLAQRGARITVIDRGEAGRGCSYGNAGHIATEQIFPLASPATLFNAPGLLFSKQTPLTVRPGYAFRIAPWLARFVWASRPESFRRGTAALARLQSRSMPALQRLFRDAGIRDLLQPTGSVMLVESKASCDAARKEMMALRNRGAAAEWLCPSEAMKIAPAIAPKVAGAVLYPDTGHVKDPYAVCQELAKAVENAGGEFRRGEVAIIKPVSGGGFHIDGRGVRVRAKKVVIAAGAWSKQFAAQLGLNVPLETERGYHLTVANYCPDIDIPVSSYERKVIMTPMRMGLRITGCVEFGGLSAPEDRSRYLLLERHLQALLGAPPPGACSRWMGFRPSMPDHLPVIRESPAHKGAVFAFGHQHLGLTLAGITADMVSSFLSERGHAECTSSA